MAAQDMFSIKPSPSGSFSDRVRPLPWSLLQSQRPMKTTNRPALPAACTTFGDVDPSCRKHNTPCALAVCTHPPVSSSPPTKPTAALLFFLHFMAVYDTIARGRRSAVSGFLSRPRSVLPRIRVLRYSFAVPTRATKTLALGDTWTSLRRVVEAHECVGAEVVTRPPIRDGEGSDVISAGWRVHQCARARASRANMTMPSREG